MTDGDADARGGPRRAVPGGAADEPASPVIGTLEPVLRPYGWGSPTAIPELLGIPVTGDPVAEAWYGAHPSAPSTFRSAAGAVPLTEVIAGDPRRVLGAEVADRHGDTLPFLVKLLAADEPLSIQAHPSAGQAAEGFRREEAAGVPVDAPGRLYRDLHAKPELVVALEPFDMLCGFREPEEAVELLGRLGAGHLGPVATALGAGGAEPLRGAAEALRAMGPQERALATDEVAAGAGAVADGGFAAACAWLARLGRDHPGDIGVLFAVLMNHRRLEPLEACFLPARTLHAYLRGTGVEVMGNSDNVLRAGLTPKHVAVDELLGILDFRASQPPVLAGPGVAEDGSPRAEAWSYTVPTAEFAVDLLPGDTEVVSTGPEVLVAIADGSALHGPGGGPEELRRGRAVFVGAGVRYRLSGRGTVVRASVGIPGGAAGPG